MNDGSKVSPDTETQYLKLNHNALYNAITSGYKAATDKYKPRSLQSNPDLVEHLLDSDFYSEKYEQLSRFNSGSDEATAADISQFKSSIREICACGYNTSQFLGDKFSYTPKTCDRPGCPNCTPYLSRIKLSYIEQMQLIGQLPLNEARQYTKDLNKRLHDDGIDTLTVNCSPTHNGLGTVRIGCILPEFNNPLVERSYWHKIAQNALDIIKSESDFLQTVDRLPSNNRNDISYMTEHGQIISSVDIYMSRPTGCKVLETGTQPGDGIESGLMWNEELGVVTALSKKEAKAKAKEEKGVIASVNLPELDIKNVSLENAKIALTKTVDKLSVHNEKAVFAFGMIDSLKHFCAEFSFELKINLEELGNQQPNGFRSTDFTQEDFDRLINTYGVTLQVPSDILSLDLSHIPIEIGNTNGLRDRRRILQNNSLLEAQQTIANAPTKAEYVDKLFKSLMKSKLPKEPGPEPKPLSF